MCPRVAKAQPWAGISERFQRYSLHLIFHTASTAPGTDSIIIVERIRTPMLQAEFSANAEKAARCQTKNTSNSTELQVALCVHPFKCAT
jgi:hypothetical protein